ncbi:MAG: hypothetical protein ACM3ZA_08420 [Bacillota bacterium]
MAELAGALVAAGLGLLYLLVRNVSRRLPEMTAMLVAMAGAMTGGLTLGLAAHALFPHSLAHASLAGLALGIAAGALLGSPAGWLPVLDGSLSGGMGGLMGAMLAMMLDASGLALVAAAFLVLFAATVGLLFSLVRREAGSLRLPGITRNISPLWRWGAGVAAAAALASYLMH